MFFCEEFSRARCTCMIFQNLFFYIHNNPERRILLCNVAENKATCYFLFVLHKPWDCKFFYLFFGKRSKKYYFFVLMR